MDIVVKPSMEIKTVVFRKETHTNQYLSFESHHPLTHKLGVVRTLLDRCESHITHNEDKQEEETRIKSILKNNHYPVWSINRVKRRAENKGQDNTTKKRSKPNEQKSRGQVVLPYIKGLSKKLSVVLRSNNIGTSFKPHTNIRNFLVHPKDKIDTQEKCGVVYQVMCGTEDCGKAYIGETGRKLKTRMEEHKKDVNTHSHTGVSTRSVRLASTGTMHRSAITDHAVDENHVIDWRDIKVLSRDSNTRSRQVREAIWIRKGNTMNRDKGGYQLSHVYDGLLKPQPPRRGGRGNPQ